jgi:hypothetical protein
LGGFNAREDRTATAAALDQDRKPDRGKHENNCRPGCHPGEEICGAAGPECRLRSLAAKRASQVGALALLEKNNPNQDKANNYVKRTENPNHA